ncbi:MspA family porin [Nocardia sp. XZ_19_385]|uniref:MspA family porin n=1 Tax=Nocardia sp. XZ_19_385 TaxID=2769488 RepID=UPI00188EC616|nr:MspA family porin [Nocardia sp. XZ_19_385]
MRNHRNRVAVSGLAAAVTAIGLLSAGAANADTFIPLPGGELTRELPHGMTITVRLAGESATINPSLGNTPLSRNTWVSGTAHVELTGGDRKSVGAKIAPGYIVGCQVDIGGGRINGTGKVGQSGDNLSASTSAGGRLTLGPGQAGRHMILDLEAPDDYGNEEHSKANSFRGPTGSVTWADATLALDGCAGYAQARAFVIVKVRGAEGVSVVTLWGQPFSLG